MFIHIYALLSYGAYSNISGSIIFQNLIEIYTTAFTYFKAS